MRYSSASYDYNVICQVCREKIKASVAVKRWDGLVVGRYHEGCYETRHPLDMPQPPSREDQPLPFTSPEPEDTYLTGYCTIQGRYAVAGYAVAGCAIAGFDSPGMLEVPTDTITSDSL